MGEVAITVGYHVSIMIWGGPNGEGDTLEAALRQALEATEVAGGKDSTN